MEKAEIIKQIDSLESDYYQAKDHQIKGFCVLAVIACATGLDIYFGYGAGVVGYVLIGAALCFLVMESDKAIKAKSKLNVITLELFNKEYLSSLREVVDYKYNKDIDTRLAT